MEVDRCVCAGVSFAELLRLQNEEKLSFKEIRDCTGVGRGCSICRPYVRMTLKTGRASHPVLTAQEVAWALRIGVEEAKEPKRPPGEE